METDNFKIDFDELVRQIRSFNAVKVGIQLPDGLKFRSSDTAEEIEKRGFQVILSGSSSYGACDVDIALLEEVDVLVHIGHSQLLNVEKVIYIPYFTDYSLNFDDIKIEERKIALIATIQYAWKLEEVKRELENRNYEVELRKGRNMEFPGQVLGCNYSALKNSNADAVLFIGDGFFHPAGAAIYTGKKVYRYSPLSREFEEVRCKDFLKKRLDIIAGIMYSDRKGAIVVSSKPGQKRLKMAERLKKEAEGSRKVDIIFTDEVTPSKLSNFPYGYFVNTACPRITYDDAELFPVPLITPYEFEILIGKREWNDYKMDGI